MNEPILPPGNKLALAAMAGCILLASLGISVTTVALPTLASALSTSIQQVQWVVLAYLVSLTVAIVSAGRMGDLYGSRRVLLSALVLFTLASIACAVAPNMGWLIVGRVGQGLAAAVLMALPMSLAKSLVAKERMGAVMGLLGTMSAIGTALGPSLGGGLIDLLGWRSIFILLLLCALGMIAIALMGIPKDKKSATTTARLDWAGSLWLCLALLFFSMAATGGKVGMVIPIWMLLASAAIALVAFVGFEMRATHPLIPLALLGNRALASSLSMNLIVSATMMSTLVVGPFYLAFGLGLSELVTGVVMAVGPAAAALSGVPAGQLTDRFGTDRILLAGLALATAGLICFALLPIRIGIPGYVVALILTTPGFQLFLAANNTAAMTSAPDAQRGMVSGLVGLSRNLGFMTGASLIPLLFATLLGDQAVALSSPSAVGEAFSHTFLLAAASFGLATVTFFIGKKLQPSMSILSTHQGINHD
ncbi:MFS transporter [Marinobacter daepoensis]|uniref:MFS transporter n=1 Tax=Marinobacter daepoensis TaxID=262077 RepID=UPI001C9759BC|nr:MFS transporter [Marinobacter daepoensis]MBY6034369.1 MFS transporter [Marinobacter daepoensis]